MSHPTIIIADDHPLLLKGLQDFITEKGYNIVGSATNGQQAYNLIVKHSPEIAVLDIEMPGLTGLEIAQQCLKNQLETKIILITLHKEKELYLQAKELNVFGYVLKEFAIEEIEACLQQVVNGKPYFTPKITETLKTQSEGAQLLLQELSPSEKKILRLIAHDKTTPEIADMLFISARTVDKHRSNIIAKLNLNTKTNSLLIWAKDHKHLL